MRITCTGSGVIMGTALAASRIEDYALIGDMHSAALVARNGSIDWLCMPRFDSDACFTALLGTKEHGRWSITPAGGIRHVTRAYRPDTLVLQTDFECDSGVVRVIDFMPLGEERHQIVRIVEGISGEVPVDFELIARFGYGAARPMIGIDAASVSLVSGPDALELDTPVGVDIRDAAVRARITVRAGTKLPFVLSWHASYRPRVPRCDAFEALRETETYWREWAARCAYRGPYRDFVVRSLLSLRAMTYAPTGGIVAAPTTSLPEEIGGERNWDYRFCWLRDAALTLVALVRGGYADEAAAWRDWLVRAAAGDAADAQIMYGIAGERRLSEYEVPWLPGYEGSHPVRVGNAASEQFQLDVYGEVLAAIYYARRSGMPGRPDAHDAGWHLVEHVERVWSDPDDGIWEVRGGRKHFTHSKVMAWAAMDRAVRMIEELAVGGESARAEYLSRWRTVRDAIRDDILEHGFDNQRGCFTQSYGSAALDASVLVIPHFGFLTADDPRMVGTVRAIEQGLLRDGFVRRYATESGNDGLSGDEGVFLPCSFWLADNYAMSGRVDDAEKLFERLVSLRNDLGLLAEEYDPAGHRMVGNFPQAFTHVGAVYTAFALQEAQQVRKQRSPQTVPRAVR